MKTCEENRLGEKRQNFSITLLTRNKHTRIWNVLFSHFYSLPLSHHSIRIATRWWDVCVYVYIHKLLCGFLNEMIWLKVPLIMSQIWLFESQTKFTARSVCVCSEAHESACYSQLSKQSLFISFGWFEFVYLSKWFQSVTRFFFGLFYFAFWVHAGFDAFFLSLSSLLTDGWEFATA